MKKFLKILMMCLVIVPSIIMFSACKEKPDDTTEPENNPVPPTVTLTSVETEVVDALFASKFNESTKTFTIEYGDALPNISDFELTASYSDGSSKNLDNIKVLCPLEFYENNMIVREAPYNFEIVEDGAESVTLVEFYVEIVKKKVTVPTMVADQTFVFDGNAKTLAFDGFDDDVMNISNNIKTDANNYICEIELKDTDNYEWTQKEEVLFFDWSIAKAKLEPLSLTGTYVYNGTEQTVEIDYKTYSEDLFEVTNNKNTDANTYVASIELINNNYEWNGVDGNTLRLEWVIEKAKLEPLSVVGTYVYNGSEQTAVIDYKTYDEDLFELYNHKQTDANTYKVWVAIIGNNHEWIGDDDYVSEIDWVIDRKPVATSELPSVVGEYVYTGGAINVVLDNKFDDDIMSIKNGSATEVGKHTVKIYLDSNHKFADETIEQVGYYAIEWEIVEPEPEIMIVDLSGYDITDWVGSYNTVVDETTKTISLSGLPDQVDVSYTHTKDGVVATADEFDSVAVYVTTATIKLKGNYADTYRLPTSEDVNYIPTITNARYESIVIEEDKITISFTWKIYTRSVTMKSPDVYEWNVSGDYPVVQLNKFKTSFDFDYIYFKYDETNEQYVKVEDNPTESGNYKVVAEIVCIGDILADVTELEYTFVVE